MKVIFASSKLRGEIEFNQKMAEEYGLFVAENFGYPVIQPHLHYTRFLDDNNEEHRRLALEFCFKLVERCDELWAFIVDGVISEGMRLEIEHAKKLGIPVHEIHLHYAYVKPTLTHTTSVEIAKKLAEINSTNFEDYFEQ